MPEPKPRVPDSEVELLCQGRRDLRFHYSIMDDLALDLRDERAKVKRLRAMLETVAAGHDGSVCGLAQEFLRAEAAKERKP